MEAKHKMNKQLTAEETKTTISQLIKLIGEDKVLDILMDTFNLA